MAGWVFLLHFISTLWSNLQACLWPHYFFEAIAQNYAKTKGPTKKIDKINFEVHGTKSVFNLLVSIEVLRKHPQLSGQFRQNLDFSKFLKKWKMAKFKSKNLCDESSKIKNLRWQFSCIFCCLRRSVLRFFCRRCYHGDICRSKSPNLQIFKKDEKWAFSYGKIRPLEMIFFAFFPSHLLCPSESYVLHPRTLIRDSKWGFPAMIADRS